MIASKDLSSSNIALNLYKQRTKTNLTHEDLSEILEVSIRTIYFWEDGKKKPTIDNLIMIADLFGVSLEQLLEK